MSARGVRLRLLVATVLAAMPVEGCRRPRASDASLVARTDLARLAQLVAIPAGATSARWIVRARGVQSMVPGPTDTELVAYVVYPPERWTQLEGQLGAPQGIESRQLDDAVARAVLPASVYAAATGQGDRRRVRGARYALSEGPSAANYRGNGALRLGDALLLVRFAE